MIEQALIFFGSATLLVPIFHRLGLGSVLGYLIAGMLVGPQGLKLVKDVESSVHLAELGVILLLFMIGLEIQPRKLWAMRRHLFGLGGSQIIFTSLIFCAIGTMCGLPLTTAGVLGFSLSLSSTAFALQTLTDEHQLNTQHGQSSFSILLMQDLVAIPALALIPALGAGEVPGARGPTLQGSLIVIGVIVVLLFSSRYLMAPLFRFIASTRSREIFTAATLFVVLGVALLMEHVGLSAALGTFVAGVLLAESEYRHELESDLDPFKSLLMGLFFIAIGMQVSLELIARQPFLIFGLAIAYLAVKASVIYSVSRLFGQKHGNSMQTALTIAQGGEFAFVIFTIAYQNRLAETGVLSILNAVITISMAASPLLLIAHRRWQDRHLGKDEPRFDEIQDESPKVIVAGFGRFGQVFGRVLRAQNIPFVAIDHDPDQIELVRRFGNKVYYGDVERVELLHAAGAGKAKYLILAIDDVEASLNTARLVREHFPSLTIMARARNRGHAFDLMDLGIKHIKRETFDSSVHFVRDLLVEMGWEFERANKMLDNFRQHDEIMLSEQFKVRRDDKMFVSVSKQGAAQLEEVLRQDSIQSYVRPSEAKI